ncbi:MAG: hypothetical protein F4Z86_05170 [Gemmatimonadetes bacterium]|nr:hypothetical protein [Gemmatimonadota bacterium]
MGTRKKFWYSKPNDETNWLFKHPRPNTGEHWAEKIAAEVAFVIGIRHANVELAQFQEERGSVTESFALGDGTLYHGNQMLEVTIEGYKLQRRFHQSSHTLANIWKVMDSVFVKSEDAQEEKLIVAEYLVLDALIGNTDRHHENWGVLRWWVNDSWRGLVAPSYDHASSLGRELLDERRNMLLTENRVGDYAKRGRGAIYWSENERYGPSPLELVRRAADIYPELFYPASSKLAKIDEEVFSQIVNRIPSDWMTSSARKFAVTLMRYNYEKLREIFR